MSVLFPEVWLRWLCCLGNGESHRTACVSSANDSMLFWAIPVLSLGAAEKVEWESNIMSMVREKGGSEINRRRERKNEGHENQLSFWLELSQNPQIWSSICVLSKTCPVLEHECSSRDSFSITFAYVFSIKYRSSLCYYLFVMSFVIGFIGDVSCLMQNGLFWG